VALSDEQLISHVEQVYDNNFSGGCCMDSAGNVYFSETVSHNIRYLLPPVKQSLAAQPRFAIYKLSLPDEFQGISLGGPVTG